MGLPVFLKDWHFMYHNNKKQNLLTQCAITGQLYTSVNNIYTAEVWFRIKLLFWNNMFWCVTLWEVRFEMFSSFKTVRTMRHPYKLNKNSVFFVLFFCQFMIVEKPTDITAVTEATDSEHTAATVVETPNVRRGGRGKGRKGVATKEIAQVIVVNIRYHELWHISNNVKDG